MPTYPKSPETKDNDDEIDNVGQEHENIDISGRSVLGVQNVTEEAPQGLVDALSSVDGQPQRDQYPARDHLSTPMPTIPCQVTHSARQKLFSKRPAAFILSWTFTLPRVCRGLFLPAASFPSSSSSASVSVYVQGNSSEPTGDWVSTPTR